jgi:hypothetical protein
MLHVTNGDHAAERIRAAGFTDTVLPWRDVLHEGPVPAPATLDSLRPLRARFLAGGTITPVERARQLEERDRTLAAHAERSEVVLWFEHDLYDQLQLAQILDWFAAGPHKPPTLVQADDYLGRLPIERYVPMFDARHQVTSAQLEAAQRAWRAFTSPDPRAIEDVLMSLDALPFMGPALERHLEEFPSVENGLSRTERQALEVLVAGPLALPKLFEVAHLERENPFFLGDLTFFTLVRALSNGEASLVRIVDDAAQITETGRDVLSGRADRVNVLGIDRWLGGVHLKGPRVPWRWDRSHRRLAGVP